MKKSVCVSLLIGLRWKTKCWKSKFKISCFALPITEKRIFNFKQLTTKKIKEEQKLKLKLKLRDSKSEDKTSSIERQKERKKIFFCSLRLLRYLSSSSGT